MKKQRLLSIPVVLFFASLLLSGLTASARLLPPDQDEKKPQVRGIIHATSSSGIKDLSNLMGSEECDEKDEECLKRRMVEEAHLDYIYTQHHKPKAEP